MQRLNPTLVNEFEEKVKDPDTSMLDYLWPHVHPHMAERKRARKAILVTLASHADKAGMRGRCHTLMVGPPGTGKTELRNWARYSIGNAHGIGPKSSEAGLKGDASGKELTPGALNMAHGGVLCIEELDKFAKSERDALYEAMSEGEYEINQADIREIYPAEVRAIATANGTEKFAPAILDRFDFVIEMEEYDEEETVEVTDTLYDSFASAFLDGEPQDTDAIVPEYLKWIEPYEPDAEEGVIDKIKRMKNYLIQQEDFAGGIRKKQAWFRVSYTIAKIEHRDLHPDDFIRAVELLHNDSEVRRPLEAIRDGDIERLYS